MAERELNWPASPALRARIQRAVDAGEITKVELAKLTGVTRNRWTQILNNGSKGIPNLPQVLRRLGLPTSAWLPGLEALEQQMLAVLESVPGDRQSEFLGMIEPIAKGLRPKSSGYQIPNNQSSRVHERPESYRPKSRKNSD